MLDSTSLSSYRYSMLVEQIYSTSISSRRSSLVYTPIPIKRLFLILYNDQKQHLKGCFHLQKVRSLQVSQNGRSSAIRRPFLRHHKHLLLNTGIYISLLSEQNVFIEPFTLGLCQWTRASTTTSAVGQYSIDIQSYPLPVLTI